jgi:hypothetical protein
MQAAQELLSWIVTYRSDCFRASLRGACFQILLRRHDESQVLALLDSGRLTLARAGLQKAGKALFEANPEEWELEDVSDI